MSRKRGKKESSFISAFFTLIAVLMFFGLVASIPLWLCFVLAVIGIVIFFLARLGGQETDAPVTQMTNASLSVVQNDLRIMNDCLAILNTSKNIETVIYRYNDLLAVLARLSEYEGDRGISFSKELPSAALARMQNEKTKIMSAAVKRAYNEMMEKCAALKTEKGRQNCRKKFFDSLMKHSKDFPPATNDLVSSLMNTEPNENHRLERTARPSGSTLSRDAQMPDLALTINADGSTSEITQYENQQERELNVDFVANATISEDGRANVKSYGFKIQNKNIANFVSLEQRIMAARNDDEKIHLCERALSSFPAFVEDCLGSDGELPPVIPCRDMLPELYMRRGDWEKAEDVVKLCISSNAYGYTKYRNVHDHKGHWISETETGKGELLDIQTRQKAANATLAFLRENPGTLQKDIYKVPALSSCDHDALVWFCRSSRQIRKEQFQKTNKLYAL